MKKSLLYTWTLPLLIFSIVVAGVRASPTTVSIEPSPHPDIPEPGVTFQVNATIQDVTDLAGYEFYLRYDTAVVNATLIEYGGIFGDTYSVQGSEINNTEGWLRYAVIVAPGETAFSGSGVLATITFNATGPGGTGLGLYDTLLGAPQDPTDPLTPVPIDHETIDGSVVVIPEFPPSMIMPLFLIITLIAVILGKLIWSRRGREPSIAR